ILLTRRVLLSLSDNSGDCLHLCPSVMPLPEALFNGKNHLSECSLGDTLFYTLHNRCYRVR
ncbi:hypothetical protein J6590_091925, partial [Homalodisca vitripennis]